MSSLPTHLIITFFLNSNLASYCIYNFHCECEFLDRNGILQKLKKFVILQIINNTKHLNNEKMPT